ncbi:MAG TPA: hypothetical protein VIG66_08550, partial [Noviherbaspirillum sp.]
APAARILQSGTRPRKRPARGGPWNWCWNVSIPPAPVQTAHPLEVALTRENANGAIIVNGDDRNMTQDKNCLYFN